MLHEAARLPALTLDEREDGASKGSGAGFLPDKALRIELPQLAAVRFKLVLGYNLNLSLHHSVTGSVPWHGHVGFSPQNL